jgi:hypothetical protein
VLIANDRPPKTRAERQAAAPQPTQRALAQHDAEDIKARTIDADQ